MCESVCSLIRLCVLMRSVCVCVCVCEGVDKTVFVLMRLYVC